MKVLFVCSGNICRSPTAEGVFRRLADQAGLGVDSDSCGLEHWHIGKAPDSRAIATARRHGVDISGLRARQVQPRDFDDFDLILAMDRGHFAALNHMAPPAGREKIRMFLSFGADGDPRDVPDPYYGGDRDFAHAYELIRQGAEGLVAHLRRGVA